MKVDWPPHARRLFAGILTTIAEECSIEDAYRWRDKIDQTVSEIADYPLIGPPVPKECFFMQPYDLDQLHQIICRPYRIVYEATDTACHILSIRHARMMLGTDDTTWN